MKNEDKQELQYEKPWIVDHGDLTDLTSGLTGGHHLDSSMPSQHDNPDEQKSTPS